MDGRSSSNVTYKGSDTIKNWRRNVAIATGGFINPSISSVENLSTDSKLENLELISNNSSKADIEPCQSIDNSELDSNSNVELNPTSSDIDQNTDQEFPIEAGLTINVPPEAIEDDCAIALVQVVPSDLDTSDIPEKWDIYHLNLAEESNSDGEYPSSNDGSYYDQNHCDEFSSQNSDHPDDNQEVAFNEFEGSNNSEDPHEGYDSYLESIPENHE